MKTSSMQMLMLSALFMALVGTLFGSAGSTQASGYEGALHWMYASGSATGGKRVHLRIVMTEPAPEGGINVALKSSDPSIPVPAFAHVNTGETEEIVGITTVPVVNTKDVKVTATFDGVSKTKTITILEAYHSSLSLQTRIRAGGLGRVTVRLSGRAPIGGITVNLSTTRSDVFKLPVTAFIPQGAASAILRVSATDNQPGDTNIAVTSNYPKKGKTFTKKAIVRHYDVAAPTATATNPAVPTATATSTDVPTATATSTDVATATATSTDVPTATATNTEEPIVTATETEEPTATATETEIPTATATSTVVPPAMTISPDALTVPRGSTVHLTVCLVDSPVADLTITWVPDPDSPFLYAANFGSTTILAGATGQNLCFHVDFVGKNQGGGNPIETGFMIFSTSDGGTFYSPEINWE